MKLSPSEVLLDIVFDTLDYVQENTLQLKIMLAFTCLGISTGFTSAKIIPNSEMIVLEKEHLTQEIQSLQQQYQETLHAAAENEEQKKALAIKKKELEEMTSFEKTLTITELQNIYAEVAQQKNVEACEERLKGKYALDCKDHFYNIEASLQANSSLCERIENKTLQTKCLSQIEEGREMSAEKIISLQSEQCESQQSETNKTICWNSLYLNVALSKGDPITCEPIKDRELRESCRTQATKKKDETLYQQAIEKKQQETCNLLENETMKKNCIREIATTSFIITKDCDKKCTAKKIEEQAVSLIDIQLCHQIEDNALRSQCYDMTYRAQAVSAADSRICLKIADETIKRQCVIPPAQDKNPDVVLSQFKIAQRSLPKIGDPIQNPFEGITGNGVEDISLTPKYQEPFKSEQNNSIFSTPSQLDSQSVITICEGYSNLSERITCEDTLILQYAIPNKDSEACLLIENTKSREHCVQQTIGSNIQNACSSFTNESAKQLCLEKLGINNNPGSAKTTSDCLLINDPKSRIQCIRSLNTQEEGQL